MLTTSILDESCPTLYDAVTKEENARSMIDKIERENLFLVVLDYNREWYCYHHLFRECLREFCERDYSDDILVNHQCAAQTNWEAFLPY